MELKIDGQTRQCHGTLVNVSADNPAACLIGGFKQLHSALRKCRHCLAVDDDIQRKVITCTKTYVYVHTYCCVHTVMLGFSYGCMGSRSHRLDELLPQRRLNTLKQISHTINKRTLTHSNTIVNLKFYKLCKNITV